MFQSHIESNALSFYRSQNVLCRSKFFEPDQKFIYILWQSQKFCARQKDDLHSVKLVFVSAQKFLKRHSNLLGWLKKFGLAQNILGPVKGLMLSQSCERLKKERPGLIIIDDTV